MSTGIDTPAAAAALAFLTRRQLASGAFEVRVGPDIATAEPDASLFATAMVAGSLGFCETEEARALLARSLAFLHGQMEREGVWRFRTTEHEGCKVLPPDLDDTAYVSSVLRRHGVPIPDNTGLILANRDRNGLFYTWLVGRLAPFPRHAGLWRVALRRWRRPVRARRFWRDATAAPDDVDGVVNANVLHYLGRGPQTEAVVDHILDILRRGAEGRCDKWYRSPFAFYYAVARASVAEARDMVCARIAAAARADGRIGDGPLDTALAACALAGFEAGAAERHRACSYLAGAQSQAGSWPAEALYFGGPPNGSDVIVWGSEELTTGFCLEALARCPAT